MNEEQAKQHIGSWLKLIKIGNPDVIYTQNHLVSDLLKTAALLVEKGEIDRAAWRIADAGLMLRIYAEERGYRGQGIDEFTGLGAKLPTKRKTRK